MYVQEVEQLQKSRFEIELQLRTVHGSNTSQNFSSNRRTDRGYSSEVETGRPGRGGNRGRGRGGGGRTTPRYHDQNKFTNHVDSKQQTPREERQNNVRGDRDRERERERERDSARSSNDNARGRNNRPNRGGRAPNNKGNVPGERK